MRRFDIAWRPSLFELAFGPRTFDCDVLAFDVAGFLQPLPESGHKMCERRARRDGAEEPDHRHRRLLRARRERPRRRAAKERDELAPFHSITSSARPISGSGMVRPRALAVFRLMINSTLVACCTGRSVGFSPLRILAV